MKLPTVKVPVFGEIPLDKYHQLTMAVIKLLLPWSLLAFYIISIFIVFGDRASEFFALLGGYIGPAGRAATLSIAIARGFPHFLTATYLIALDIIVAMIVLLNWDALVRLPAIGRGLMKVTDKSEEVLYKERWVYKLSFAGIALLMMQPIIPGGSILAAVVSRIMGLTIPGALLAIAVGSSISSFAYAYAAAFFTDLFRQDALTGLVVLIVFGLLLHQAYHRYIKPLRDGENKV